MTDRLLLPPFTADAGECAKCGYDLEQHQKLGLGGPAIATTFVRKLEAPPPPPEPPHSVLHLSAQQQHPSAQRQTEHPVIAQIAPGQEALLRMCRRCDYPWAEACIDDPDVALSRLETL